MSSKHRSDPSFSGTLWQDDLLKASYDSNREWGLHVFYSTCRQFQSTTTRLIGGVSGEIQSFWRFFLQMHLRLCGAYTSLRKYECVCECVGVCVRACVCVCARVRLCVDGARNEKVWEIPCPNSVTLTSESDDNIE